MAYRSTNISDHSDADNDLVAHLLGEALTLFEQDLSAARQRIEHAFVLSQARNDRELAQRQGTLADWQVRRVVSYIQNNLGSSLRIAEVAKQAELSASYFSRAFKATIGTPYSDFVANARLSLAKRLLLTTEFRIAEIALMCGLADQSHLTRLFNRSIGLPPYAWRRALSHAVREQRELHGDRAQEVSR